MSLLFSQNHTPFSVWIVDPTGVRIATASVVPRAPQIPGVPPQCESSCSRLDDFAKKILAGGDAPLGVVVASCSDTIFQSLKSCVECGYNILPAEFPQDEVRKLPDQFNKIGEDCNELGLPVQPITFNLTAAPTPPTPTPTPPGLTPTPTPTGTTGAALSRYEGSERVAGAIGVAAVAGFLAL